MVCVQKDTYTSNNLAVPLANENTDIGPPIIMVYRNGVEVSDTEFSSEFPDRYTEFHYNTNGKPEILNLNQGNYVGGSEGKIIGNYVIKYYYPGTTHHAQQRLRLSTATRV